MTNRSTIAAVVSTALAVVVAAPLIVQSSDEALISVRNLGNCVLTLAPTSQVQFTMTAIGWEETSDGVKITIHPQDGAAVTVGDSSGVPLQGFGNLPASDGVTGSTITVALVGGTLVANVNTPQKQASLPVTTEGSHTKLGRVTVSLESHGHLPNHTTKLRSRIWVNYYGLRTAVTIIDG